MWWWTPVWLPVTRRQRSTQRPGRWALTTEDLILWGPPVGIRIELVSGDLSTVVEVIEADDTRVIVRDVPGALPAVDVLMGEDVRVRLPTGDIPIAPADIIAADAPGLSTAGAAVLYRVAGQPPWHPRAGAGAPLEPTRPLPGSTALSPVGPIPLLPEGSASAGVDGIQCPSVATLAVLVRQDTRLLRPASLLSALRIEHLNDGVGGRVRYSWRRPQEDMHAVSQRVLVQGRWHLLSVTLHPDGASPRLVGYVDGRRVAAAERAGPLTDGTSTLEVGEGLTTAPPKAVAEVGLWHAAMPDEWHLAQARRCGVAR